MEQSQLTEDDGRRGEHTQEITTPADLDNLADDAVLCVEIERYDYDVSRTIRVGMQADEYVYSGTSTPDKQDMFRKLDFEMPEGYLRLNIKDDSLVRAKLPIDDDRVYTNNYKVDNTMSPPPTDDYVPGDVTVTAE